MTNELMMTNDRKAPIIMGTLTILNALQNHYYCNADAIKRLTDTIMADAGITTDDIKLYAGNFALDEDTQITLRKAELRRLKRKTAHEVRHLKYLIRKLKGGNDNVEKRP